MGNHLYRTLILDESYEIIPFDRSYFEHGMKLQEFVSQCDVIVHLAAMNRHEDQQVIYNTNIKLVDSLIAACKSSAVQPHIIFSSSTQEERDNLYGQSKKLGKQKFIQWASVNGGQFTSLTIPNIFGPFGKPEYNSVVATFCHKVARNEEPTILKDAVIDLIYINDLVKIMIDVINGSGPKLKIGNNSFEVTVKAPYSIRVSELLNLLRTYQKDYMMAGIFPNLEDPFQKALFNTFRCYIPDTHYPVKYQKNTDNRGYFVEIARTRTSGQFSFSTTVEGITRGNHYHTRKAERFAVIKGKALIQIRKTGTDNLLEYYLDGDEPAYVDMPIWHTHNITNIGKDELITLFWINEPYDPEDPDTYFETV